MQLPSAANVVLLSTNSRGIRFHRPDLTRNHNSTLTIDCTIALATFRIPCIAAICVYLGLQSLGVDDSERGEH